MNRVFFVSIALFLSALISGVSAVNCDDRDIATVSYTFAGGSSCSSSTCDDNTQCVCDSNDPENQFTTCAYGCQVCNKNSTVCALFLSSAAWVDVDVSVSAVFVIEGVVYTKGNSRGTLAIAYGIYDNFEPISVNTTFTKGNTTKKCASTFRTNPNYGTLSIKLNCTKAGAGVKAQAELCINDAGTLSKCPYKKFNAPLFGFLDNGARCGYYSGGATTSSIGGNTSYQLAAMGAFHGGRRMNQATKTAIIHTDERLKFEAGISDEMQKLLSTSMADAMTAARAKQREISNSDGLRRLRKGENMNV